ncbi:hypothetical protein [Helicobacter sp. 11S02596-1]|uniref:hypothetical protein n=1 Tax=Helicobacter sp. 11S02596-1 TaxID=1476194 RepID=UPI000BA570CB|nr:hypothetical protein [Helicobacter sp. 11S02596-1]PAF42844.1 hypothetical protein BJI48_06210 [Helicobacter sp. 11S02596-1]
MKILLINSDSMVTKLFEAVAKKLGLELVVQGELVQDGGLGDEDKIFLFVDDSIEGEFADFIQTHKPTLSCYLHKRSSSEADGFDFYVKKPFLPTEILDVLKPKLAEFGITDETTSNITKNDLEELSDSHSKGSDLGSSLDDFDLESLESLIFDDKSDKDSKTLDEDISPESAGSVSELGDLVESEPRASLEEKYSLEDLEEIKEDPSAQSATIPESIEEVAPNDLDADFELSFESEPTQKDNQQDLDDQKDSDLIGLEKLIEGIDAQVEEESFEESSLDNLDDKMDAMLESFSLDESQKEDEDMVSDFTLADEEMPQEDLDLEALKDTSDTSGVLDKDQIQEVKKILEETTKKDTLMEEMDKVENFEHIDEKDIMNALGEEASLDSGDLDESIPEEASEETLTQHDDLEIAEQDAIKDSGLDNIGTAQAEHKTQEGLSNNLSDLIANTPLESLKSLLDGMQLTINISFPDKKK